MFCLFSDKTMPLDLSRGRVIGSSSDLGDDDDDKDDIIVTLALPGRQDTARHYSEPIVIPSDSEDSDADVTIVSDFSTLGTIHGNGAAKSNSFGEVLGVPIAGPSDDTDDDCFVSFSSTAVDAGKVRTTTSSRGVHAGIKRIFEDSSSQSSVDSPASPLDGSFVQGKDAFLSDASSQSSAEDLGLVLASADVSKNLSTSASCASDSPTKASLPPAGGLNLVNNFDRKAFNIPHSATADDCQDVSQVKGLSAAASSTSPDSGDLSSASSKMLNTSPASSANSNLSYGISQLLAGQRSDISALKSSDVHGVQASKSCPARTVPVTDLNSLFCVPSFDSLYPDASSSSVVDNLHSSLLPSKFATSKPSTDSDVDVSLLQRTVSSRRRSSVVKSNSTASVVSDTNAVTGIRTSRSPCISSNSAYDKEWTVQSKGGCKVLLRRSVSQTTPNSSPMTVSNVPASPSTSSTPVCKRRRLSAAVVATALDDVPLETPDVMPSVETSMCYGCRQQISISQLSYCMAGHGCCGQCLQSQVKTLLASGKKVVGCFDVIIGCILIAIEVATGELIVSILSQKSVFPDYVA
jgi:hypothetical protein